MRTSARNGHSGAIASEHEATGLDSIARGAHRKNRTKTILDVEEAKHSDEKT